MTGYKAVLFDLDDTLLDRDMAIEKLFFIILEKCYRDVTYVAKNEMLKRFKKYDNSGYGNNDKAKVLESFFDEFSPTYRLQYDDMQHFWNSNFPNCFSIDQNTIDIVNAIKKHVKVAIITNGSTQRQKAKIMTTDLNSYFDTIIISEEVGISKPDKRIFELALNRIDVEPEDALFVGDHLVNDVGGCQGANMNGIWFNPQMVKNDTEIKPFAEIHSLDRLLGYFI